jgi:cysteine-rich repeat protein
MLRSTVLRLTFAGLATLAAFAGCASSTGSGKAEKVCTPGNYVFCRCANREEGTKLCNDEGTGFGKCEPCETPDNPELPDADPFPPPDASDARTDGPPSATCGDKIVQDGEDCDDGNKVDSDGCDQQCKLAGADPLATRSCPGLEVHVWSSPVVYDGTTTGSPNTASSPTCPSAEGNTPTTGAAAGDRVFKVTVHKTGTLKVTTSNTSYNNYLYASDGCKAGENAYLACANKVDGVGGESISLPVQAGKTYTVFVDGAGISGNTGTFRVTFSM